MNTGDVVTLNDGSTGVVGEAVASPGPQLYRVYFSGGHITASSQDVSETLAAAEYSVGDEVSLWPYGGTISAIDGDEFTLSIERQESFDFGPVTWTGTYKAPRWRIIRDNDSRIERIV